MSSTFTFSSTNPYNNYNGETTIIISNDVTSIPNNAFHVNSNLETVIFQSGSQCSTIGNYAFSQCTSLTSINIPDSVISIGEYTFNDCSSLTSINIPDSVTSIGEYAFYYCTSLTSINIPNTVQSIGQVAFDNCTSLTSINIPDNEYFTIINYRTFSYCSSLVSVHIPSAVTEIADSAFNYSTSINTLTFASDSKLETIGDYAFQQTKITEIEIPASVTYISGFNDTKLTSVILPDGVTTIGYVAFYQSTLTTIYIPPSITTVNLSNSGNTDGGGKEPFEGSQLNTVYIPNDTTITSNNNGTTFTSPATNVSFYGETVDTKNVFYYDGTNAVNYNSASDVIIDSTVTYIQDYAFNADPSYTILNPNANSNIETVIFYSNSQCTTIGNYSFTNCTSLISINIPDSVTSIGEYAFYNCTSLTSINIPNGITIINDAVFGFMSNLTSITIPNSVKTIGDYSFTNCSSLISINIPDSVTSFGNGYAFNACTSLTSINIPNGVSNIPIRTFANTSSLTSITIPNSVTNIDNTAFTGSTLNTVTISYNNPLGIKVPATNVFFFGTTVNIILPSNEIIFPYPKYEKNKRLMGVKQKISSGLARPNFRFQSNSFSAARSKTAQSSQKANGPKIVFYS